MSLRREDDGTIVLFGSCPVDEAEPLHRMLLSDRSAQLDWTQCSHLHSAIVQLVIAAQPTLAGPCGDPFVERWLAVKQL
jgi:hypothetical protein